MASEPSAASSSQLSAPSSAFSFTAPFPPDGSGAATLKQRRASLPSSPRLSPTPVRPFRYEMGLETMSASSSGAPVASDENRKLRNVESDTGNDPLDKTLASLEEKVTLLQRNKQRRKWTMEETQMLADGCKKWGVGNWKIIANDPKLSFDDRSPGDLRDRFRNYFSDAYNQHHPNAKTHFSSKVRSALPDGSSIFEKSSGKIRRPFTPEEDEALKRGYGKHGSLWASILKDPVFHARNRRPTDLRDRFRTAFPDLYEAAGFKPRKSATKKKGSEGLLIPVGPVVSDSGYEEVKGSLYKKLNRRKRTSTAPGPSNTQSGKSVPESTTSSDSEESSGGEKLQGSHAVLITSRKGGRGHAEVTPQSPDTGAIYMDDLPQSQQDSSRRVPRRGLPIPSSRFFSEATDSSQPRTWSLPEHGAQREASTWISTRSPPPRGVTSGYIFLSSNSSPQAHPTRRGSEGLQTMIGKSAWVPEDWLSANPRLESPHPDSSSSSFIEGPSPALKPGHLTPGSAGADRQTLAKDILRALLPPSTKRKRDGVETCEGTGLSTNNPVDSPAGGNKTSIPDVSRELDGSFINGDVHTHEGASKELGGPSMTTPVLFVQPCLIPVPSHATSRQFLISSPQQQRAPPQTAGPSRMMTQRMIPLQQPAQFWAPGSWNTGLYSQFSPYYPPWEHPSISHIAPPPRQRTKDSLESSNTKSRVKPPLAKKQLMTTHPVFLPSSEIPPVTPNIRPPQTNHVLQEGREISLPKSKPKAAAFSPALLDANSSGEMFGRVLAVASVAIPRLGARPSRSRPYVLVPQVDKGLWLVSTHG